MSITSHPASGMVLEGYAGLDHGYDELVSQDGLLRPHWQTFAQGLDELGLDDFTQRWREAQQLIRENGVTYNVYGDPRGLDRPWQLDPIPVMVRPDEAEALEGGLLQRGRLLEALLQDLYGPQQSLAAGLLPPELLYANPAYLRALRGLSRGNGKDASA